MVSHHLNEMILPFQPILSDQNQLERIKKRENRYHYALPFILISAISLDTIIQYQIYGYDPEKKIFFHQIALRFMPDNFIIQASIIHGALYSLVLFYSGFLFFDSMSHADFILIIKKLNASYLLILPFQKKGFAISDPHFNENLLKLYYKFEKASNFAVPMMMFAMNLAYTIPLFFYEIHLIQSSKFTYFPNLHTILCLIVWPFYLIYLTTSLQISAHFMYQNCVIQAKQKYYLSHSNFARRSNETEYYRDYRKFLALMVRVLNLTQEIESFNKFYSKYITIIIITYTSAGLTAINSVVRKAKENGIFHTILWIFFGLTGVNYAFTFNLFSSITNFFSGKLIKYLRSYQLELLSRRYLSSHQTVKLSLGCEFERLLYRTSFRLWNSIPINTKLLFFHISFYLVVIYLKLYQEFNQ